MPEEKTRDLWVSPERDASGNVTIYDCTGPGPVLFMIQNPLIFALQPADIELFNEPDKTLRHKQEKYGAMLDRMFHMGWLWVHVDVDQRIRVEIRFDSDERPEGVSRFRTIMQLITQEGIPDREPIMLQPQVRPAGPGGRGYAMFAASIRAGRMFWDSEDKPPCPVCGAQINKDELIETMRCPKCKTVIA